MLESFKAITFWLKPYIKVSIVKKPCMKNKFLDPVKSKGKEPYHNNKEEEMDEDVRLKGGKELRQTKQITKINLDN